MRKNSFAGGRTFGIALSLWIAAENGRSAPPRLETPLVGPGQVTLRLTGEPGQSYRLEGSTNLQSWFEVGSGPAVGGTLTVQHARPPGAGWHYYRGVLTEAARFFPSVSPSPSPDLVAATVLTPEAGAVARITSAENLSFTATIPTNAVFDLVPLRMTVLTNVAGVPAEHGFLAGVRFEPDGLVLASPFFLQIDFPTNIPASQVSSYAFGNDGRQLHLVPDIVVTNRVKILVTQLRSYACGVFTPAELAAQAATAPPPAAARTPPALHASMEECYPDDEAEARKMRQELEDRIRPYQQRAAAVLGAERQRQLLGVSAEGEGAAALERVFTDAGTFYEQELKSRIPAAKQKCAKARELIPWILGYERQRQLLGAADDDAPEDPAYLDLMCNGMKRCQDQALECCRRGGDTRLITFLLGLERQRQLLGMGDACGSLDVQGVLDECAPKWIGSLTVVQSGSVSTNRSNYPNVTTSRLTESWQYTLQASVASVEVSVTPQFLVFPAHTNLTFQLTGTVRGEHHLLDHYEDLWDGCGGGSQLALARVGLHDGGSSLKRITTAKSELNQPLEFTIRARILPEETAALGITPYLNFNLPPATAPFVGRTEILRKEILSGQGGCDIDHHIDPVDSRDPYGGHAFFLQAGEFEYAADSIRFYRKTPKSVGGVTFDEELTLDLRRIR